jgi:hypothetical protein
LLIFAFAGHAPARDGSGPGGIQTKAFGLGAGYCSPPELWVAWDAANHGIAVTIKAITPCPSYPITENWIVYGSQILQAPYPLLSPTFIDGSELYMTPIDALGPFGGATSFVAVPPDPSLVGTPIVFQAIVGYGTSPFQNQLGVTDAQLIVFVP